MANFYAVLYKCGFVWMHHIWYTVAKGWYRMQSFKNKPSLAQLRKKARANAHALFWVYGILILACALVAGVAAWRQADEVWVWMPAFLGTLLLCIGVPLLVQYRRHSRHPYSLLRPAAPANEAALDEELWRAQLLGPRIALGAGHLFYLASSFYIPFCVPVEDVVWMYFEHGYLRYGRQEHSANLYVVMRHNKTLRVPLGGVVLMGPPQNVVANAQAAHMLAQFPEVAAYCPRPEWLRADQRILLCAKATYPAVLVGNERAYKKLRRTDFEAMKRLRYGQ